MIFESNTLFTRDVGVDWKVQGEGASLKSGREVREQASEVDWGVGGKCKSVWGNLKAMTEKGENFKIYQTKTGLLE